MTRLDRLGRRGRAIVAAAVLAVGCRGPHATAEAPVAATDGRSATAIAPAHDAVVYVDAEVLTLDPEVPRAAGIRVADGVITHVWTSASEIDRDAGAVRSLAGATIIPGLIDGHLHIASLGLTMQRVDLADTRTIEEALERVRVAAAGTEKGVWILGRGWDQTRYEGGRWPTAAQLDEVSGDHPVALNRIDGHALWANSRAMEIAGVGRKTPDPAGGKIHRDPKGAATGIFVDNAMGLVMGHADRPSDSRLRAAILDSLLYCRELGLVGVHDMGTTARELAVLRALDAEGALPIRVTVYLGGDFAEIEPELRTPPDREGRLRVVGVKRYADGALGSRGAALLAPYADDPSHTGLLVTDPETLTKQAKVVHDAGYQLAIHAIGDRGNRSALEAIEAAQGADTSRRHRIEHAQILDVGDLPRLARGGVVASMQPIHATSDMRWAEARVGAKRLVGAYAWATLLRYGTRLVFGSDAPVEPASPWLGLHAALTRKDAEGQPPGGWRADEAVDLQTALRSFSVEAAWAAGDDPARAMIRPGARADLTIVGGDLARMAPEDLRTARPLAVIVDGQWTALPATPPSGH